MLQTGRRFQTEPGGKVHNIEGTVRRVKIINVHGEDLEDCPWTIPLLMLP